LCAGELRLSLVGGHVNWIEVQVVLRARKREAAMCDAGLCFLGMGLRWRVSGGEATGLAYGIIVNIYFCERKLSFS
jgi:hypothetical protein